MLIEVKDDKLKKRKSLTDLVIGLMIISYQLYSFMPYMVSSGLKVLLPLIALLFCIYRNGFIIRNTIVTFWIFSFIIVSLITMFDGIAITESTGRLIAMVSALLFLSAIAQYIRNEEDINKIINHLLIGSVIHILFLSAQNFTNLISLNLSSIHFSMEFNYIITPVLYFLIWSVLYRKENRLLMGMTTILLLAFSLISAIKKAFFFPFVYLGLLLFIKNRDNLLKSILSIIVLTALLIPTYNFSMSNEKMYANIGRRIEGFTNYFTGEGRVDGSTRVRIGLAKDAWNVFLDNPIRGVGLDAFRTITKYKTYAHNNFLELLASTGLLGFVSFYWIHIYLVCIFFIRIRYKQAKEMDFLFVSIILTNLLHDMATISYFRLSFLLPICLAAGYLRCQCDRSKVE